MIRRSYNSTIISLIVVSSYSTQRIVRYNLGLDGGVFVGDDSRLRSICNWCLSECRQILHHYDALHAIVPVASNTRDRMQDIPDLSVLGNPIAAACWVETTHSSGLGLQTVPYTGYGRKVYVLIRIRTVHLTAV